MSHLPILLKMLLSHHFSNSFNFPIGFVTVLRISIIKRNIFVPLFSF
jgi:hypothetical protein